MKLIMNSGNAIHVSIDSIREFEIEILKSGKVSKVMSYQIVFSRFVYYLWRVLRKIKLHSLIKILCYKRAMGMSQFILLMGTNFVECFPHFLNPSNKYIYLFDAWPADHAIIKEFVSDFNIKCIFISSSQAAKILNKKYKVNTCWIPEGIDHALYKYRNYNDREIDVLAFGRKFDNYHNHICNTLHKENKKYLYEKNRGEIIFPTRKDFINGLANTKISICFPGNQTHPFRSGGIETMTIRYLQSMASKCLIVGHAPEEMIELFGYNPVIEVDFNDPAKQILEILKNYYKYYDLIERNYNIVIQNHTLEKRWFEITKYLEENFNE